MTFKAIGLAALVALAAPAAHAATATGSLGLSITIAATCSVISAPAINFGTVSAIAANIDQTSTLVVNCSTSTPYSVGLSVGGGTGATVGVRKMMNGTNAVNYTLYRDAARTLLWGDTIGTDVLGGQTGNATNQSITIYGRTPAQTVPPPGNYTDTVTVTINY
jgi:spore coat protein U-like protein